MKKAVFSIQLFLTFLIISGCSNLVQTETKEVYVQVDYNRPNYESVQVGDVILENGSIIPYIQGYGFTNEQREQAIGVVVYSDKEKALCIGLNTSITYWSSYYQESYTQHLETFLTKKDGTPFTSLPNGNISDIGSYSGYACGSNSYAVMDTAVTIVDSFSPAFKWIKNYGITYSLNGNYQKNWYMPALQELLYVYENYNTIMNIFSALNVSSFSEAWASSVSGPYPYSLDFANKKIVCTSLGKEKLASCIAFHNVVLQ